MCTCVIVNFYFLLNLSVIATWGFAYFSSKNDRIKLNMILGANMQQPCLPLSQWFCKFSVNGAY